MNSATLFSGIGGPDIAADEMGWNTVFQCEIEPFPQKVLRYYWPNAKLYEDITKTDFTLHRGSIDVLTGGFPCQPFSISGKRKGANDHRHLWPEMLRCIKECRPRWVIGENVAGITSMVFDPVQTNMESQADIEGETIRLSMEANGVLLRITEELEEIGYSVQPFIIPACAVNAPHRRYRIWIVANAQIEGGRKREGARVDTKREWEMGKREPFDRSEIRSGAEAISPSSTIANPQISDKQRTRQLEKQQKGQVGRPGPILDSNTSNANGRRQSSEKHRQTESRRTPKESISDNWKNFPTQSPICGGNDGLPSELVGITFPRWRNESIKAYGNAIVPQEIYEIYRYIEEVERIINGRENK